MTHPTLALADALASCVQTYPQMSEDEPGGYCTEADQLMDEAAARLRTQHADLERKDALLRRLISALESDWHDVDDWPTDSCEAVYAIKQELAK